MNGFRSNPAFFHDPRTHTVIDRIADWDNLVIYVGSGATIDRTGYSWWGLVDKVLTEQGYVSGDVRGLVRKHLDPPGVASAIMEHYDGMHSDSTPQASLRRVVAPLLYDSSDYFGGALVAAIANLAAAWVEKGKQATILTPNYDVYVVEAVVAKVRERAPVSRITSELIDWTDPNLPLAKKRRVARRIQRILGTKDHISVVHLHGSIPKGTEGVPEGFQLVFSEGEYEKTRATTDVLLRALLKTSNVLIVGAGMSDPPLIRNLLAARSFRETNGLKTAALVTLQSMVGSDNVTTETVAELSQIVDSRMKHLGIDEVIFPDFYYQNAQLLEEIAIAAEVPGKYSESESRYGRRLVRWWRGWQPTATITDRRRDLELMQSELGFVVRALGRSDISGLQVELWLRWGVDNGSRSLRQWIDTAASTAAYRSFDHQIVDDVEILSGGTTLNHAVADVFCSGRQASFKEFDEMPTDSWVGSVVTYRDSSNSPLPVGVVVLRGPKNVWGTIIGSGTGSKRVSAAFEILHGTARQIMERTR